MADRKLRVLILKEKGVTARLADDIREWEKFESERGIILEIDEKRVEIPDLTHESFKIAAVGIRNGVPVYEQMFGLSGIKQKVRALEVAPPYTYHAVIFIYNRKRTDWDSRKDLPENASLGHWCYFEPLYPGTSFIELITYSKYKPNDPFRVLSHEIRHSHVFRLRAQGIPVEDVMDSTYVPAEKRYIPYWKEFEIHAPDGNRARQDAILKTFHDRLTAPLKKPEPVTPPLMPTKDSPRLVKWAEGIKHHEGWKVGSRSYRHNNPGNFKTKTLTSYAKSLGAIGQDKDGFWIFGSYAKGWAALLQFLRDAQANDLIPYRDFATKRDAALRKAKKPEGPKDKKGRSICTLNDFYQVYAPKNDNVVPGFTNDPNAYALAVARSIDGVGGVTIETPLDKI